MKRTITWPKDGPIKTVDGVPWPLQQGDELFTEDGQEIGYVALNVLPLIPGVLEVPLHVGKRGTMMGVHCTYAP